MTAKWHPKAPKRQPNGPQMPQNRHPRQPQAQNDNENAKSKSQLLNKPVLAWEREARRKEKSCSRKYENDEDVPELV